ncbi:MAG: 5' nucleotidase, NT5C type [Acidobacteriaceae bacterium]
MQIFLDCDGVLADFEGHAQSILHEDVNVALKREDQESVWQILLQFEIFRHLPVREDGRKLFRAIRHLHPIILTGCPPGGWAEQQKREWAFKHFPGVPIITCASKDKRYFMENPGDILIDDYQKFRGLWEAAGGIFVHYRTADQTLRDLAPYLESRELLLCTCRK